MTAIALATAACQHELERLIIAGQNISCLLVFSNIADIYFVYFFLKLKFGF